MTLIKKMSRYNLTANQVVMLYFLTNKKVTEFKEYKDRLDKLGLEPLTGIEKRDLIKRGFLKRAKGKIVLNREKDIFTDTEIDVNKRLETFVNTYPSFYDDGKKKMPLKMVAIIHLEGLFNKTVKDDDDYHELLEDVKYGKEYGIINMRIDKFLIHSVWKDIRNMRKKSTTRKTDNHGDF